MSRDPKVSALSRRCVQEDAYEGEGELHGVRVGSQQRPLRLE